MLKWYFSETNTVCLKKRSLAKNNYWHFKPIWDIPFNLLRLQMIPGHVKALQDTLWCPYSVAYSPYKSYNRK